VGELTDCVYCVIFLTLMDTTTAQLYDILVEKGFDKSRVREALSEVVSRDEMSTYVDQGFDRVRAELRADLSEIKADVYKAMLLQTGAIVAILAALYGMFGG